MRTKNILLGIFSLLTFATYAQAEKNEVIEIKRAVTELKVKTGNLDELKNFDWNMINKMFELNEKDQDITLAFAYINNTDVDKSKIRVDNFDFKFTGKTAELEILVSMSKNMINKLIKLNEKIKN